MSAVEICIRAIAIFVGSAPLLVCLHGVWRGASYIALANSGADDTAFKHVFHGDLFGYILFGATPFAILVLACWAGFAVLNDVLFPLGNAGAYDEEFQKWITHRHMLSVTFGLLLGMSFTIWVSNLCKITLSLEQTTREISAIELLHSILNKSKN